MNHAVFLEPIDVWSFRDGRPFEVGEAFEARSLFPPHPRTVLGCLRTALLRRWCPEPERYAGRPLSESCTACGVGPCRALPYVGEPGGPPPFEIGPPLLARREGRGVRVYYPAPRDLVYLETAEGRCPTLLAPLSPPPGAVHCLGGLRPIGLVAEARVGEFKEGFLGARALAAYLRGSAPALEVLLDDCAPRHVPEPRIGIGISAETRAAREGQLYLREVVRVQDGAGLVVATSQDLGLDGEVARLGGDGRMTRISAVEFGGWPPCPEVDTRFKIYLAAPTRFEGATGTAAWHPGWLDPERLEGAPPGCGARVRLVGAAVGALTPVGGWDLAAQQPREIQWLVPAGAVFFFEADAADDARAAAGAIHGRPLCDDDSMARAGFGLAFVGRW